MQAREVCFGIWLGPCLQLFRCGAIRGEEARRDDQRCDAPAEPGGCAQKAPVRSFAELPERIDAGRMVYVVDIDGREVRGPVRELSNSAVTLSGAGAGDIIPAERISVLGTYGDPIWNGLGIGLGVGTAMALFADRREVPCPDGSTDRQVCYDAEVGSRLAAVALGGPSERE